jgi:hypothetical protein
MSRDPVGADARQIASERINHECEKCGWLAWSSAQAHELELREREDEPGRPLVLCPSCAAKDDGRARQSARCAAFLSPSGKGALRC